MEEKKSTFLTRITNVGTIIGIVSLVCLILTTCGIVEIDSTKVQVVTQCICAIGVMLGVLNNPKGAGCYIPLPFIDYAIFGNIGAKDVQEVIGKDVVDTVTKAKEINPQDEAEKVREKIEYKK